MLTAAGLQSKATPAQTAGLLVPKITRIPFQLEMRTAAGERMGEGRPDGPHVGSLIRAHAITRGTPFKAGDDDPTLRMQLGFCFENALEAMMQGVDFDTAMRAAFGAHMKRIRNVDRQIRLTYQGIHGTPDGRNRDDGWLESYKLTDISMKEEANLAVRMWYWIIAEAVYIYMGLKSGAFDYCPGCRLFVGWLRGDYSQAPGHGRQVRAYEIVYSAEELTSAWLMLKGEQDKRDAASSRARQLNSRPRGKVIHRLPTRRRGR